MPAILLACALGARAPAQRYSPIEVIDENATIEDKLGETADLDTVFTDSTGRTAPLSDLVGGERPIVLNLQYFTCPGVCAVGLNGLLDGLKDTGMVPGVDLDVLTVSIDPRETVDLAAGRKVMSLEALGRPAADEGWRFMVGEEDQIARLASSVGWRFRWSEHTSRYDHPPALVVLSPDGKTTRYLDYRTLDGSTFRRAIVEAGDGKVGSFLERILVSCLTFDSTTGVYSLTAMTVMRIGGALTVVALALMIFVLWRRERRKLAAQPS